MAKECNVAQTTTEISHLLRYFIISSVSHVILLGLLFLENGIEDLEKVESFYQENMVVDMIPLIESTLPQGNLASETREVHQGESSSFSPQPDYSTIDPTFTNRPKRRDRSSSKIEFSEDDTDIESQKNATKRRVLASPNPFPSKKLIPLKTPDLTETAFFEKNASKDVEKKITPLPMPKPRVTADFRQKNQKRRESF